MRKLFDTKNFIRDSDKIWYFLFYFNDKIEHCNFFIYPELFLNFYNVEYKNSNNVFSMFVDESLLILCTGGSLFYAPYSLLLISNKFLMGGGGGWGVGGGEARGLSWRGRIRGVEQGD